MSPAYREGQCPRDGTALIEQFAGPARFRVCGSCSGMWVSAADLKAFLDSPVEVWKLPESAQSGDKGAAPAASRLDSARCPCSGLMHKKRRRGVKVDVCPLCHAVWVDGGELARLIARHDKEREGLVRAVLYLIAGFLPLDDLF